MILIRGCAAPRSPGRWSRRSELGERRVAATAERG